MELRTLNDWVVIPRLLRAPGVADVVQLRRPGQAVRRHASTRASWSATA